jgi:hypothetical protein
MTLPGLLLIIFLLFFFTFVISAGIIYRQFSKSAVKRWRDQVFALRRQAERQLRKETSYLDRLDRDRRNEEASLCATAFQALVRTIPAEQLLEYSGIGPGTLEKLRKAGYTNIAALSGQRLRIRGLGQKRLRDIDAAVKDLVRKARQQFEADTSPQAKQARDKQRELGHQYEECEIGAKARIKAIRAVLSEMEETIAYARQVTFFRHFRPITETPPVPVEIQEAPLPDLAKRIQEAEAKAVAAFQSSGPTNHSAGLNRAAIPTARPAEHPPSRTVPSSQGPAAGLAKELMDVAITGGKHEGARPVSEPRATAGMSDGSISAKEARAQAPQSKVADLALPLLIMEKSIQFALAVARADGPLTDGERQLIQEQFRRRYAYDQALSNRAAALLSHYETASIDLESCLQTIEIVFSAPHRAALLDFGAQIVGTGGNDAAGMAFLQQLAKRWSIAWQPKQTGAAAPEPRLETPASRNVAEPRQTALAPLPCQAEPPDYRTVLEIEPLYPLSADLIRRQYQLLHKRFDPSSQKSLGADFVAMAEKKQIEIATAARALLLPLGEKLETPESTSANGDLRPNQDLEDVFRN